MTLVVVAGAVLLVRWLRNGTLMRWLLALHGRHV
jgi:hypothetical protein